MMLGGRREEGPNTKSFSNHWNKEMFTGPSSAQRGGVCVWREQQDTESPTASRLRRGRWEGDTKQLMVSTHHRRQVDVMINKAFFTEGTRTLGIAM